MDPTLLEGDLVDGYFREHEHESLRDAVAAEDQEGSFDPQVFSEGLAECLSSGHFRLALVLDEAQLRDLNGEELETAVLEPLTTTVLEEAIRNGINHPSDTFGLVLISAHIIAHNTNVGTLACMEGSKLDPIVLRDAIKRLKWRQEIVADLLPRSHRLIRALGSQNSTFHEVR